MNPETESLTTTHDEDLSQIYACQHAHKYLPLSNSHQVGLTDGSTVSCDQSSAARQAYLAKYCHSKPSIDLWKPHLQSTTQRVLQSSSFPRRCHKISQIQPYYVTRIPHHVSSQRQYLGKYQHHHITDDPRSLENLSSLNVKYQQHKNLTKMQKTTSRSQISKLHQSVSNELQLLIEQVKEQERIKEQQKVKEKQKVKEQHKVKSARLKEEREANRKTKQFNKTMRERRIHYLLLLNQQISSEENHRVTDDERKY